MVGLVPGVKDINISQFLEERKTFKPIEAMEAAEAVEANVVENVAEVKNLSKHQSKAFFYIF